MPNQQHSFASNYITDFIPQNQLKSAIGTAHYAAEADCVTQLMKACHIPQSTQQQIDALALTLSTALRNDHTTQRGHVHSLLQQFSLSSQEGIALMCLAEALLRIPDASTRDLLIEDKISHGDWHAHIGKSPSLFVNAAAWGLLLTGRLLQHADPDHLSSLLRQLFAKSSRGLIRHMLDYAMRMMGEQFVMAQSIDKALQRAHALQQRGFRYSYDMLGEAALTASEAERYYQDYLAAIHAIGRSAQAQGVYDSPGISIKLSALHPRYQRAQLQRVEAELYPQLLHLATWAKHYQLGLNIDAEESERLALSFHLLERLCFEPELADWDGLGFVIQAYQKRACAVVDEAIDLAKRSQHRLMIRLVKGAYWDREIKKAQQEGTPDYPVFTRKAHTDLAYLTCAQKLLTAIDYVYPQFATHNAQTFASIYVLAQSASPHPHPYEFQCLHGMGEALYQQVVGTMADGKLGITCRIYAPIGKHDTLLAYLVRRLLENGANTSFVHRISDASLSLEDLIESPQHSILKYSRSQSLGSAHPALPHPLHLYGNSRLNSMGLDLNGDLCLTILNQNAYQFKDQCYQAMPLEQRIGLSEPILNPANPQDVVGHVWQASATQIESALQHAVAQQHRWQNTPKATRAACLQRCADLMQQHCQELMLLLVRESGKSYANALAEVREAIDFLRYYAAQILALAQETQMQALGALVCISPWNFPLAIFTGQVAAALVTGNSVLAKPAEQTPLIAAYAVKLFWQAGVPKTILQLLPGTGEQVGAALVQDQRVQGVLFTGSTQVAKLIQHTLAKRVDQYGQSVTLIAETGGQNAMLVDSSALCQQVVTDVLSSAFDSAGQRCSALRLLCVQQEVYPVIRDMLIGAMQQLQIGNPKHLATDVGPVIDHTAQRNILQHIEKMRAKGYAVHQTVMPATTRLEQGYFIAPTLIELPDLNDLQQEIFGPVLHLISYQQQQLSALIDTINAKGYGLTMGLQTRLDQRMHQVMAQAKVGNLYINRNMVGAVVGVQPFGGEGLSGTGPKAGGPLYLYRLMHSCHPKPLTPCFATQPTLSPSPPQAYLSFSKWCQQHAPHLTFTWPQLPLDQRLRLVGPTGEQNDYVLLPQPRILSIASERDAYLQQWGAILSIGSQVVLCSNSTVAMELLQEFPADLQQQFSLTDNIHQADFNRVLYHGKTPAFIELQQMIAQHQEQIISLQNVSHSEITIERLLLERAVSINTTAAGGNASLMSLD